MSDVKLNFSANTTQVMKSLQNIRGECERFGKGLTELFMGAEAFASLAMRAGHMFSGLMKPAMDMEQLAVGFETKPSTVTPFSS